MEQNFNSKIRLFAILAGSLLTLNSCAPSEYFIHANEAVYEPSQAAKSPATSCNKWQNYASDPFQDPGTVRTIRVNLHFMNSEDSSWTFGEKRGTRYANDLIVQANALWANNRPMNLPLGNETPVLPTRIRLQLTPDTSRPGDDGIYFHYDDSLGYYNSAEQGKTLFGRGQYQKYGVRKNEVLNIFLMEHYPDSLGSPTYVDRNHGVGYRDWVKVIGTYQNNQRFYVNSEGDSVFFGPWFMARLLNHELGHALGLSHAWGRFDQCEDTPPNPNCWNYTNSGPCDSLVSNNLMDYNTYQNAVTPCQIGLLHYRFSKPGSESREKLIHDFCKLDTAKDLTLSGTDTLHIKGYHDFYGNVNIGRNTVVVVHCDITMPANSTITLQPKAQLILKDASISNACGKKWQGIRTSVGGENRGRLILGGKSSIKHATRWLQELE